MASSSSNPTPGTEYTSLDSQVELWYACAGEQVQIPQVNSQVYYFVQGHVKHVKKSGTTVDMEKIRGIPTHPILCRIEAINYLADPVTDDVLARIKLVPITSTEPPTSTEPVHDRIKCEKTGIYKFEATLGETADCKRLPLPNDCARALFQNQDVIFCKDISGGTWKFSPRQLKDPGRVFLSLEWRKFVMAKVLIDQDTVVFCRQSNGKSSVGIRRKTKAVKLSSELVVQAAHLAPQGKPFHVLYCPRIKNAEFIVSARQYLLA